MEALLKGKSLVLVIPVYNEEKALRANFHEIKRLLAEDGIHPCFHFVDDGSRDGTWQVVSALSSEYEGVTGIKFARNFGKEIALRAGVESVDADLYLTMDSDLQHPPRYIKDMLEVMAREGCDIVDGVKASRGHESFKHRFVAKSFYKVLKSITGLEMDNSSDFKLMNRQVIDALREFHERNLFFRGIVSWVGFKTVKFPFEVDDRTLGETHFSVGRLFLLAMSAILSYTSKPLYLTIFSGILFLLFALIMGIQTLYNFFFGHAISGFSTVILLILITGSMIMLSLGIIGVYIARIYEEIKRRPRYIIERRV
ncbi:MAG: glycosyltransferase family 2 protein [Firmicutes bacterium]|nr:glycosyltransferase family 2 protein [Bacillota bacterium]